MDEANLLGGVTTIDGNLMVRESKKTGMYHRIGDVEWKTIKTSFIPYYAWSNRGEVEMSVWLPIIWYRN